MTPQNRISYLRQTLDRHNREYYVLNESTVTDAEYDALYAELVALEAKHPELADPNSPTKRVGAKSTGGFKKLKHDARMLSLENIRTAADIIKYLGLREVVLEPKIDGASLKLIYRGGKLTTAITRGDGDEGDDVTANARAINSIPLNLQAAIDLEVKGEIYMRGTVFDALNRRLEEEGEEMQANPRNAAAGALKLKDPQEVADAGLSFVAYGITSTEHGMTTQNDVTNYLGSLGFQNVYMLPKRVGAPAGRCGGDLIALVDEESLNKKIDDADKARKWLDLPTDGLVFKLNSLKLQRELGEGVKYPRYACAFKFKEEMVATIMSGITIQIGRSGRVTPVAELEPVTFGGSTVSRASLMNQDEIKRLGVNLGDVVFVQKSAEIIPRVVSVYEKIYIDPKTGNRGTLKSFGLLPEQRTVT